MTLNTKHDFGPNRELNIEKNKGLITTLGLGAVPTAVASYVTAEEYGDGTNHRTVLTFDALPVTTVDNGTAGNGGGTKIYDFPQGYIQVIGGAQNWDTVLADGTGILADTAIDIAVGSTVADSTMDVLSGTAEDIVNKLDKTLSAISAVDQFVAEVTGGGIDGTSTAVDAYLNLTGTEGTADADGTLTLSGTIDIVWLNHGYAG